MQYIIDTHALIWVLEGNPRLGTKAKAVLSDPSSRLILPAIALAEALWIVERGKTGIPSVTALLSAINDDPRITIYALDQAVIEQSLNLLEIREMHDRQIVSTAFVLQAQGETVSVLTCDQNITSSGLVTITW
jgi:PIN domain nuclease of toxin-antitoxin system